jgi:hypothetical protein
MDLLPDQLVVMTRSQLVALAQYIGDAGCKEEHRPHYKDTIAIVRSKLQVQCQTIRDTMLGPLWVEPGIILLIPSTTTRLPLHTEARRSSQINVQLASSSLQKLAQRGCSLAIYYILPDKHIFFDPPQSLRTAYPVRCSIPEVMSCANPLRCCCAAVSPIPYHGDRAVSCKQQTKKKKRKNMKTQGKERKKAAASEEEEEEEA